MVFIVLAEELALLVTIISSDVDDLDTDVLGREIGGEVLVVVVLFVAEEAILKLLELFFSIVELLGEMETVCWDDREMGEEKIFEVIIDVF